jgi:hypothetical protein
MAHCVSLRGAMRFAYWPYGLRAEPFRSTGIQAVGVIGDVCSMMILARPKGQEWSRICHIRMRQWKNQQLRQNGA